MITFLYTDERLDEYLTSVKLEVTCAGVHVGNAVEAFKSFLRHVGHHPENVERVVFFEKEDRQALPMQLDLFEEDAP